jgi:ornithine cyclodeaminase/alanine dehydrogenase-like protein (mu-crystallin family)
VANEPGQNCVRDPDVDSGANAALARRHGVRRIGWLDGETGALMAVISASEITGIRTAAMTALVKRLLAPPEASCLALIGSGH